MACYHPLHAFDTFLLTDNGKPKLQIESGKTEWCRRKCDGLLLNKYVEIPCGKCVGCRLDYSRDWANRCMLESKYHENNYFLTLTYNDEHLPLSYGPDKNAEMTLVGTLRPKDLQDFIKRLRAYYERKLGVSGKEIKYFACGEYGDLTERPHYHVIVYGLPIPDIEYWYTNRSSHEPVYRSDVLDKIWTHGLVGIGKVEWESCAYVARYVMKKRKGPDAENYYKIRNIVPEFVRMSRRPGIASAYFDENFEKIYECDEIIVSNKSGPHKCRPARYFDKRYDIIANSTLADIKKRRQEKAINAMRDKLSRTSLTKEEYMDLSERNKQESCKKLKRVV